MGNLLRKRAAPREAAGAPASGGTSGAAGAPASGTNVTEPAGGEPTTSVFASHTHRRRAIVAASAIALTCLVALVGILSWGNPAEFGSEGWRLIAAMRAQSVIVILLVAASHSVSTIAFHTVTGNRLLTPSIMGFEALYVLVSTLTVFALGIAGATVLDHPLAFLGQVAVMVVFAGLLYAWLLGGKLGNLHMMLLVGVLLGTALGSLSSFLQRLLDPATYDVLTARLFGNISNADTANLALAVPLVIGVVCVLLARSRRLNTVALGRDIATALGVDHRRELVTTLALIAVLMAVTTSLVGPMMFLGFLIAQLAYLLAGTHDHRVLFPVGIGVGVAVLSSAYFVLKHVFYAGGAVTVLIELIGGLTFLVIIVKKGMR
ncbi:iron complex transport system permease protein [Arcanobacterium wilhelmae]|uniref:Iron complex transport system permease protein n=1 Tax=Arcanobacterium wilhelmae TaxID=1803177 RepID=A0ABT9NCT0_9ACTO|nr:iron chelate uptake ABC transporter family permease subunit [Arcanobacterium wilhelmae]MDP9801452.1 iron complex transport system permease protein [Arcanobacterium wilhelmae]WFN90785.1 iron chelate uptake ABC transporter family permease subunit [Arcanobacterium wilhelmae]